ncbi:MAG: glycosyltransferase [Patescibacteria group bacterium]|nr:glycosyltransferase [Patescibacteria group bacterium]
MKFPSKVKRYFLREDQPSRLLCFLVALFLVVLIFNNVVFRGGSLSMLDLANVTGAIRTTSSGHPEAPLAMPHFGFSDTGGAAFQSEPMQQFMKFSLFHHQSPYWDPYVATGSVGPETLVDNKFSPFTLLTALLGGSSIAFHFVLLSIFVLATYFLIRLIVTYFKLSFLSALTAAVVFLLNGYNVANLSSNVTQVYLYFPILLFALCAFARRPNFWRYLTLIFANILILLTTFLPTSTLIIITVYLIAIGFILNIYPDWQDRLKLVGFQILSALIAFLLLAFLWLPIFEAAKVLGLFEMYNARIFYPADLRAFLSFFSQKHFWESYNAIPVNVLTYIGNVIFHFGIVTVLIVAQVFSQRKNFKNWIVMILLVFSILCLGRIFAIPGLYQFFGIIPQIKNIGEQYLFLVIAIALTILSAYGMESLQAKARFRLPSVVVYLAIFGSILYLIRNFLPQANYYLVDFGGSDYYLVIYFYLGMIFLVILASVVILYLLNKYPAKVLLWKSLLIVLTFLELFFYMNTLRYKRMDIFTSSPAYVTFLKQNIDNNRLANYSWGFMPDLGAAYQIQQLESLNYVFPWYKRFYERNFQTPHDRWGDFAIVNSQIDPPNIHEDILDMLSVKYIMIDNYKDKYINFFKTRNYPVVYQDNYRTIFENKDIYPRAMAVGSLIKASLTPDTQGFSLKEVVFTQDEKLLEAAKKVGVQLAEATPVNPANQVSITSYENSKVTLEAKLATPAVITLMDNWHPNWKAYANGQEIYVGKINESFRGIAIPAGDYRIEFRYAPKTLPIGLWVSGIVFLLMLSLFLFRRWFDSLFVGLLKSKIIQGSKIKSKKSASFCIVIPMYNEERNAQKCVQTIFDFLKKIKQKTSMIVVDDGSSDKTLAILNKLAKKNKNLVVAHHLHNKGYGAANVTGAKLALKNGFEYVLFMDADLTQNVSYIKDFMKEMEKGTDYIKATRYSNGGGTKGVPWQRRAVSKVGNILAKIFFRLPLTDYTNGFRAVKTRILSQVKAREKGFSYLIEEVYQVSKIAQSYAEVPYILTVRKEKFSKSKFNYSPKVYFDYLKYLFKK